MVGLMNPGKDTTAGLQMAAQVASHQTRMQKIVLSWDYLRLFAMSKVKKPEDRGDGLALRRVPDSFKDAADYIGVFEPLLLEECRAQIFREENDSGTRFRQAALVDVDTAHEFHFIRFAIHAEVSDEFTDNDLLLVTKERPGEGAPKMSTYAFGVVESRESRALRVRMYFSDSDAMDAGSTRNEAALRLRAALQPESGWWIIKLSNFSTILREYTALKWVDRLPFANVILSGKLPASDSDLSSQAPAPGAWNIPKLLHEYLESNHNESQLQAIQAGLNRRPLVLIQGPPGTGKTQTILGLLCVVLHSTPAKLPTKYDGTTMLQRVELLHKDKLQHWTKASPWLSSRVNPRDSDEFMPIDGDDGFYPTSGNPFKPELVGAKRKHRAHVLVCAPSNSALDEIVLRLLRSGLRDENGMMYTPSVVRVGLNAHHSVQAVSMDNLVAQRLSSMQRSGAAAGPRAGDERDRIRALVLEEAAIVCSTLSFSGSAIFSRMKRGFDVVVIDEAAQAVEPSTLVPLMHGCKQVFLVGDPIQLPATVLSSRAVQHGYETSLFKRLQKSGYPVQMLKTQYRMHPQIRDFPSKEFYGDTLEDGENVLKQTTRPWHEHRCFGPFAFFDVAGEETQPTGSGSWVNHAEVEFILVLYRNLIVSYPELKGEDHVAVITPYKQQVKLLRERFIEMLGVEQARLIDINTVDGFQGREKDVAMFSCVRANNGKGIGFVSDFRRMNVGLTRAKTSMLVVGSAKTLGVDKRWKNLIQSAQKRRRFFEVPKPYQQLFSDDSLAAMKSWEEEEDDKTKTEAEFMEDTKEEVLDTLMEDIEEVVVEEPESFGGYDDDDD